ncbi:MAG: hypothetical protein GF334_06940 [Candidatus Altiarchaeales archaeon]|nr:hypothetical protein [Candidatus Altiarchaeales archaeon]
MSSNDKLLEAYRTFPKNLNYLDALEEAINQDFTEEHLSAVKKFWMCESPHSMTLSLYSHRVGTYAVKRERAECGHTCHITFVPDEWYFDKYDNRDIEWHRWWGGAEQGGAEQIKFLNSVVIPFMNSMGTYKDEIPLVISLFPEFASYAMENDFEIEKESYEEEDDWGDDDEDDT